ncbi:unnamed protein product, partial [Pylaiella littoralis]
PQWIGTESVLLRSCDRSSVLRVRLLQGSPSGGARRSPAGARCFRRPSFVLLRRRRQPLVTDLWRIIDHGSEQLTCRCSSWSLVAVSGGRFGPQQSAPSSSLATALTS